ncbi:hypothetical protein F8S13_18495 [Chloroflexia bacterium SDU3-3]|nr:hypothetical protein F8S13_18495 [Chloroflexia bacterium SDU3-3]
MLPSLFGMQVARTVPDAAVLGIYTGQYALHGGVVRWAAGTPYAGQIVCHLLPAGASAMPALSGAGIVAGAALGGLASALLPIAAATGVVSAVASTIGAINTARILQHTQAIMELAELNLAVTQAGFAALNRRLDQLDAKLNEIKGSVQAVAALMALEQRGRFRRALADLGQIDLLRDPAVRTQLLLAAATTLSEIGFFYEERLANSVNRQEAMSCEEYFCTALLAQARCYAELGEYDRARQIVDDLHTTWRKHAQRVARDILIDREPERLLTKDFAGVPIAEIIGWLDFAYGTAKGYGWVDELRDKIDPWFVVGPSLSISPSKTVTVSIVISSTRKYQTSYAKQDAIRRHHELLFPGLRKLVARGDALHTYTAQYALLQQSGLPLREFEQQVGALAQADLATEGFLILTPPAA